MKKFMIGFTVFALVAIGTIFAFAQKGERGGGKRGFGGGRGGFGRMAAQLDLTDTQKEQVKQITEASRAKIKPLMESMRINHQKMKTLTANGQFDEAQIQALAQEQAQISAQLIVEKQRVKAQIFQILTDEQKAKAAQMKEQFKDRFKDKGQKSGEKADSGNGGDAM